MTDVKISKFTFDMTFKLPDPENYASFYLDALYDGGCQDASVGEKLKGYIGLNFIRNGASVEELKAQAVVDVLKAIPGAKLVGHRETRRKEWREMGVRPVLYRLETGHTQSLPPEKIPRHGFKDIASVFYEDEIRTLHGSNTDKTQGEI